MTNLPTAYERPTPNANDPVPTLSCRPLHGLLLGATPRAVAAGWGPTQTPELREYLAEAQDLARPATRGEIIAVITRLMVHYPVVQMDERLSELRLEDWCDDLALVPRDCLEHAAAAWRKSSARFAPTPGQLLEKLPPWYELRRVMLDRATRVMEIVDSVT